MRSLKQEQLRRIRGCLPQLYPRDLQLLALLAEQFVMARGGGIPLDGRPMGRRPKKKARAAK